MSEHNSSIVAIEIETENTAENATLLNSPTLTSYSEQEQKPEYTDVEARYSPFVRPDYPIGWYEKSKMVINCILLLPIRLVLIGSLCILFWIISRLVFFGMDENKQTFKNLSGFRRSIYNSVGILSRIGLFFGGFYSIKRFHISQKQLDKVRATDLKIKKQNIEQTTEPYTIVCNHVSMMDTVILLSEFNTICFLALERLKSTTLFGEWMKQINCLFLEDGNKEQLVQEIVTRQREYIKAQEGLPPRLVIFPEGTTTNGSHHILFHRGAFTAGLPVQPVMIRYPWNNFCPSWETIPVSTFFIRLFTQFQNYCHVIHFPVYYPSALEQKDASVYASNVRHVMTKCSNRLLTKTERDKYRGGVDFLRVGNHSRKDKVEFHNRIISGEFEWTKNSNF